jgi:hypothetical protein
LKNVENLKIMFFPRMGEGRERVTGGGGDTCNKMVTSTTFYSEGSHKNIPLPPDIHAEAVANNPLFPENKNQAVSKCEDKK